MKAYIRKKKDLKSSKTPKAQRKDNRKHQRTRAMPPEIQVESQKANIPETKDIKSSEIPEAQREDNRNHQWKRAMLSEAQVNSLKEQREAWLTEEKKDEDNIVKDLIKASEIYFSHSYVSQLHNCYNPIKSDGEFKPSRIGAFEITKWVTDPEEDSIDKLANFYQVFSKEKCNIALLFHR